MRDSHNCNDNAGRRLTTVRNVVSWSPRKAEPRSMMVGGSAALGGRHS